MALVKPNPDRFELVSSFEVTLGTNQHWAHPVIHDGVLYIRHGNVLMAYLIRQNETEDASEQNNPELEE